MLSKCVVSSTLPVILAPEGLHTHALRYVPDPNGAVFGIGDDELVLRMEYDTRYVIRVPPERVDLPRFRLCRGVAARDQPRA